MANEPISGYNAIAGTPPTGKTARRKIVRGPDGAPKVVFVDANTGAEIADTTGYNIIEGSNYMDLNQLGLDPTKPSPNQTPTVSETIKKKVLKEPHESSNTGSSARSVPRTESNNFGYINKPLAVSVAGALPGAFGLAGKAANLAINNNNMQAAQSARGMLGLPQQSGWEKFKSTIRDNKGQVGDVSLNNNTYSVGFEALTPDGRTNLTPEEARKRANVAGGIQAATAAQSKANVEAFKKENPNSGGFFSNVLSNARTFISDLFSDLPGSSKSKNTFPEAPKTSDRSSTLDYNKPSPNAGMSMKDQYASYGAGKSHVEAFSKDKTDFSETKASKEMSKGYEGGLW